MLITIGGLGLSCSKDDNGTNVPEEAKQIVLKANSQSITVGEAVSFTALVDGKTLEGVKLYNADKEISNSYTFEKAGTFNVAAKKEGYKDSVSISIVVKEKQEAKYPPKLTLVTNPNSIYANELIELNVTDKDNNPLDGAILIFEGSETNLTSEGGMYQISIKYRGTYTLQARYDDMDSNEVVVTVVDKNPAVGNGEFLFNGKTYKSTSAATVLKGFYKDDDGNIVIGWQEELYSEDGFLAIVIYYTDAEATEDGNYKPVLPTVDNTKLAFGGVLDENDNLLG
ncbi:hypothetical protein [Myroides pelagicus]|uniref:Uncharacterized protein n=1 Tax=Myroides pelagicus TaxID=270914 RepID=A0A7K1GS01_9FLAO|nr:hypothetical protein [Myroides pelagicus]MEC4115036.1 hypothetical protein [Myroides pelagicus]MTH30734.1 hypothetical protein [Myroides pelagicus]